ncbi:toll/interleukin-1 receptor domain-containing protein [Kaistia algarum]|uniref:toll/interleukin-1 receptor domain-containing protein n=1 Tax=Kaistia algarum TaxID=2083279 RepID=UPI000CE92153|nr:toll/interleukin-1 receptor domain-containing protein [Kaistia algarum]
MTTKIFISHQVMDSTLATRISSRLRLNHSIDSYLDVIDPGIKRGEDLAMHIQAEMGKCTHLLAVVSSSTRLSWWVPWEIGVATEKDYPLATYLSNVTEVPEYLRKWPYLVSDHDLDIYAIASKASTENLTESRKIASESVARIRSTRQFYAAIRGKLGQ